MQIHRHAILTILLQCLPVLPSLCLAQKNSDDWRQFRGPKFNRTAERRLPVRWSATENIAWKTELPGPGASSPIVVGDRVFVTCYSGYGIKRQTPGEPQALTRHLVCESRNDGTTLWTKDVRAAQAPADVNAATGKHGYASHSPTSDGKRVFVHFGNSGVFAFDIEGKPLWNADIGSGTNRYGSGASLVIHKGRLLVNASIENQSFLALDPATGKLLWRKPLKYSYTTPITFTDGGDREVACLTDHDRGFVGFDLATGRELWRWTGFYDRGYGCSSPVFHDGIVYGTASNEGPICAFRPSGDGDITQSAKVWTDETRYRPRVTSPILHDDKLFWIENGIGVVFDAKTGKKLAGERLPWKGSYATPLLAEGRLYVTTNYEGTFVISADGQFKQIAHNVIGDESDEGRMQLNASPVPHRGQLLLRTNKMLYCIGRK